MKRTCLHIVAIITSLALPAFAADEHKHEDGHKGHPKVEVKIPDSAADLWAAIETQAKTLSDLVTAKKGSDIPAAAETLEALVSALPAKYPNLPSDIKKRMDGMVKNVVRALDALHEEAEEGHWDDAGKRMNQMQGATKLIKDLASK